MLAAAGVLDGHRATTHWRYAGELQRRRPGLKIDADRIFVREDDVWTSAGITAELRALLADPDLAAPLDADPTLQRALDPILRSLDLATAGPPRAPPPGHPITEPRAVTPPQPDSPPAASRPTRPKNPASHAPSLRDHNVALS